MVEDTYNRAHWVAPKKFSFSEERYRQRKYENTTLKIMLASTSRIDTNYWWLNVCAWSVIEDFKSTDLLSVHFVCWRVLF
jgi:hypothetical protein